MTLDEIEKRAREAADLAGRCSAGPWHVGHLDENLDHAEIEDAEGGLIGEIYPRGAQSLVVRSRTLVPDLAADVIALVEEVRITRAWLHAWEVHWADTTTEAEVYRAFLVKQRDTQ